MHERIPTSPTSEELDTALARILSEPSWAHRLLCATARVLEDEQPFQTMNPTVLCDAVNDSVQHALAGLPDVVVTESTMRATDALPDMRPGITAGEYALQVRAAARCV